MVRWCAWSLAETYCPWRTIRFRIHCFSIRNILVSEVSVVTSLILRTFWRYHSHCAGQIMDGLYGPIYIRFVQIYPNRKPIYSSRRLSIHDPDREILLPIWLLWYQMTHRHILRSTTQFEIPNYWWFPIGFTTHQKSSGILQLLQIWILCKFQRGIGGKWAYSLYQF